MRNPFDEDIQKKETVTQTSTLAPIDIPNGLFFNILPFRHLEKQIPVFFSNTEFEGAHRFSVNKLPKILSEKVREKGVIKVPDYFYTDFSENGKGIKLNIELKNYPAVAKAYYTKKIRECLTRLTEYHLCNFLHDTQFWCVDNTFNKTEVRRFDKYTLRVQYDYQRHSPELLLSYDGVSYLLTESIASLAENPLFDSRKVYKVAFRNKIYKYDRLPKEAKYHSEEVFPVLNPELKEQLGIILNPLKVTDKINRFYNKIEGFYINHLHDNEFKHIIAHAGKWKKSSNEHTGRLDNTNEAKLVFGMGGTNTNPYNGIKINGPLEIPPAKHFRYFFIYFEHEEEAAKRLYEYIIKKRGFLKISEFTRITTNYDKERNIVINKNDNAVEIIEKQLQTASLDPSVSYYAFYLSPYSKYEADIRKKELYYHIKEILLYRKISMQAIESSKVMNDFSYSVSNIGIAMVAKLGGIPWRLDVPENKELVIGFGAYRTQKFNTKYVGSAICFAQDGTFQEFDVFPAENTKAIAGEAINAFLRYKKNNPEAGRIIIHFYKEMSRREVEPLERMLKELNLGIPVIIAGINKTPSKSLLLFDRPNENIMPMNGTWAKVGRDQYLLNINGRRRKQNKTNIQPMPLKISLQCNIKGYLNLQQNVDNILMQIYEFSFMHWRSVKQTPIPVTVKYPAIIASFIPWFRQQYLPEHGRDSLWFL